MKTTLIFSLLLFFYGTIFSQSVSPEEAQTLTYAASNARTDTGQIRILLRLAKYYIFKPGELQVDLDSAANFIHTAENINAISQSNWATGYITLLNSYLLRERGDRAKAKEIVAKAADMLKIEADNNLTGEAYMDLSGYYDYNIAEEMTRRIELIKLAINYFERAGNIQQKAASLQMLGDLSNLNGNSYIALQYLQESLDAYDSIHYPQVQGIYCLMGFIYSRLKEYNKALEKEFLALKTAESVGDSSMQLCEIYNYLGEIHLALAENDKAIAYYNKALEIATNHDDVFAIYLATVNVATSWIGLNKPNKALDLMKAISSKYEQPTTDGIEFSIARCYIGAYTALKQFDKARPYANELLQMVDRVNNENFSLSIYYIVARFFISAGEMNEANKYLEIHNDLAKKLKNFYFLAGNQKLRFMQDTSLHDYKKGIVHLMEFNRLTDSSSIQSKNNQIAQLQVQYETEDKENQIVLLNEKAKLEQAHVKQATLVRNVTIAGIIAVLMIAGLLFRQVRLKQKNNTVIIQKNQQLEHYLSEKEWLLKEIHHRVKNNFQTVMSLLGTQAGYQKNEAAFNAITDSKRRIQSMSLIHQKLYQSNNLSDINMSDYIHELVDSLCDSFNSANSIRFTFDIQPIELDLAHCIPLGLILNEAITNSFKYAFPDNREGIISLSFKNIAADHFELTIQDDGKGLPVGLDTLKSDSMGMNLMRGLSEEIDATFTIDGRQGTRIIISFDYQPESTIEISQLKSNMAPAL